MKGVIFGIVLFGMMFISHQIDTKIRTWCQHNEVAYEIMLVSDCMGFVHGGGGAFGYNNYFKWAYAKWINSSERTIIERLLFWNCGFLYDATNPPDEYQFPLKV